MTEHNLETTEKQAFLVALRRLAGIHGRQPYSMMIAEKIEVPFELLANGGFADVMAGKYMGRLVVLTILRIAEQDNIPKIIKASVLHETLF